jgi:hypothetical protein
MGDPFPGAKPPEREFNHSFPSAAEFKNAWMYTLSPPYVLIVWCLIKQRDNFAYYHTRLYEKMGLSREKRDEWEPSLDPLLVMRRVHDKRFFLR